MRTLGLLIALLIFFLGCSTDYVRKPRPRAFPKIEYPERSLDTFNMTDCPFTFQHMSYAEPQKDTAFFDGQPLHPCWFDLNMPAFDGQVHFSYYAIESATHFDKLVTDAFKLSGEHNKRAEYIDEIVFRNEGNVSGVIFDLQGPVASPFQFYITDSTEHFLRGALYLNAPPRPDSLAPIYEFIKEDIAVILNSFEWR